jgi:hypothetical protein
MTNKSEPLNHRFNGLEDGEYGYSLEYFIHEARGSILMNYATLTVLPTGNQWSAGKLKEHQRHVAQGTRIRARSLSLMFEWITGAPDGVLSLIPFKMVRGYLSMWLPQWEVQIHEFWSEINIWAISKENLAWLDDRRFCSRSDHSFDSGSTHVSIWVAIFVLFSFCPG